MRRIILLASLLLCGAARAAALPPVGDYLDTSYIDTLRKTRSPLRAARPGTRQDLPQLVSVQRQGSARRIALSWNWHQGQFLAVLQRNGVVRRELAWGAGPDIAVRQAKPDQLCLTARGGGEHCYRFVGDATVFITHTVLAGRYTDRQGAAYTFGTDGIAHFPGYDFRYALMLDQVADPYDFFATGTEGRFMAFRRDATGITLFNVGPPHGTAYGTPDFSHKLAVLRSAGPRPVLASN